jgi:hypothetical protein
MRAFLIMMATVAIVTLQGTASRAFAEEPIELFRSAATESKTVDHSEFDKLLAEHVSTDASGLNRVSYQAFDKDDRARLASYIKTLEGTDPATLDRGEQFAWLVNLYNAKTIEIVVDNYPVKSIKDINLGGSLLSAVTGGPWKKKVTSIKGTPLSLDDIEHEILRPLFSDPRVHYAVNCASVGCPNLNRVAFSGRELDAQLDAAARSFINSPRGIDVSAGKLRVSSIFIWFQEDFGGDDESLIAHLRKYAEGERAKALEGASRVDDDFYDWAINVRED